MASDFDEQNLHAACLRMLLYPIIGCGGSEFREEKSFRMCGPVDKGASECVAQLTKELQSV